MSDDRVRIEIEDDIVPRLLEIAKETGRHPGDIVNDFVRGFLDLNDDVKKSGRPGLVKAIKDAENAKPSQG